MDLLQRWRDVYQEAIHLADAIGRLPEKCECGDAEAHLEERCRCCGTHAFEPSTHGHAEGCTSVLTRLRADLSLLHADLSTVAATVGKVAGGVQRRELLREVLLAGGNLQELLGALERVSHAVAGFRRSCAVTELKGAKRYGVELREHCDQLDAELRRRQRSGQEEVT